MELHTARRPVYAIWSMMAGLLALAVAQYALRRPMREEGLGHLIASLMMGAGAVDAAAIAWSILVNASRRRGESGDSYRVVGLTALCLATITCVTMAGVCEGLAINAVCIGPAAIVAAIIEARGRDPYDVS